MTTLDERSKAGRKRDAGTSDWQRTFAGGHENRDPSVTHHTATEGSVV